MLLLAPGVVAYVDRSSPWIILSISLRFWHCFWFLSSLMLHCKSLSCSFVGQCAPFLGLCQWLRNFSIHASVVLVPSCIWRWFHLLCLRNRMFLICVDCVDRSSPWILSVSLRFLSSLVLHCKSLSPVSVRSFFRIVWLQNLSFQFLHASFGAGSTSFAFETLCP